MKVSLGIFVAALALVGCGKGKSADSNTKGDTSGDGSGDGSGDSSDGTPDAVVSPGDFPVISNAPGRVEYTFEHDGLSRVFLVYVPDSLAPSAPLMMALHGGGGKAKQTFDQHPVEELAEKFGVVAVAAQGTPKDGEENSFDWNGQVSLDSGVDDVGYLARILEEVTAQLGLDPKRRYLAGFSGGASMTIRMGAERSDLLTAIATFAGKVGLSEAGGPIVYPPVPTTPLSVQLLYGTDDPNLEGELKGDVQATSARAGIEWWASQLGCGAAPANISVGTLSFDTYPDCDQGVAVRLVVAEGIPHAWPEEDTHGLAGTKLLFEFFDGKTKP